jgi:DNA-binding transcriptional MerR regulator
VEKKRATFTTSRIAELVGVHPNTVRLYEEWGFLQAVPRAANGYRLYGRAHLDQMRLARTALHGGWPGRPIRRSALSLVRLSASGDCAGAREQARKHLALVRAERRRAEQAAAFLERWAAGKCAPESPLRGSGVRLSIGDAADQLESTVDTLRSWERNRLIKPPRSPSGYRVYGPAEIGRLRVIRMLYLAGYSTMSILRFMSELDPQGTGPGTGPGTGSSRGNALGNARRNARTILDTPRPGEDVYSASDRWLTALADLELRARALISLLNAMLRRTSR